MKQDIQSPEDVHRLIGNFYKKVMQSTTLSTYFTGLDWEKHLPRMEQFWRFILLDEPGYITNVTEKHLNLPLTKASFEEWLALFVECIDDQFEGPNAHLAKERARVIALGIQSKMKLLEN
ncbi:MAG: group III truncated hemoglobin [Bacteroidota bacterium]